MGYYIEMVQTQAGAKNSEWLQYMRECAVTYRKRKDGLSVTRKEPAPVTAPRRRKRVTEDKPSQPPDPPEPRGM